MNPLIAVLIQNLPGIIAFAREQFADANPGAPVPTEDEVIAAYLAALATSLAKDENWLAAHPE
jgi:hypothetical protein